MFQLTQGNTLDKHKVKIFKRCDSLIGRTITLIQETNRVLKENQFSKKYKYLGVMEDINNKVGKVVR
jgi:hypothetical protein